MQGDFLKTKCSCHVRASKIERDDFLSCLFITKAVPQAVCIVQGRSTVCASLNSLWLSVPACCFIAVIMIHYGFHVNFSRSPHAYKWPWATCPIWLDYSESGTYAGVLYWSMKTPRRYNTWRDLSVDGPPESSRSTSSVHRNHGSY